MGIFDFSIVNAIFGSDSEKPKKKKSFSTVFNDIDFKKCDIEKLSKPIDGEVWSIGYHKLLNEPHVIVGGTTGSGKSVLLHSFLYSALVRTMFQNMFVFIDLKRVELAEFKNLPHTVAYVTEPDEAIIVFNIIINEMEERYKRMTESKLKKCNDTHIWVIIDELADLMTTEPVQTVALLTKIMRLGRAANIHVFACTQSPNRRCLPAEIAQNTTCAIALRCRSAIESRQIIGIDGAETLPQYGKGILWNSEGTRLINIPMVPPEKLQERIDFWVKQK